VTVVGLLRRARRRRWHVQQTAARRRTWRSDWRLSFLDREVDERTGSARRDMADHVSRPVPEVDDRSIA